MQAQYLVATEMKDSLKATIDRDPQTAKGLIKILIKRNPHFLAWELANGQNVLCYALVQGRLGLVKDILMLQDDCFDLVLKMDLNKRHFIFHSISLCQFPIVAPLIDALNRQGKHQAIFAADIDGNTPVHCAAKFDSDMLGQLLGKISEDRIKPLINQLNDAGDAPLHIAIKNRAFASIIELINRNAHLSIQNNRGGTPIRLLSELENDGIQLTHLLSKIDPEKKLKVIKQLRQHFIEHVSDINRHTYFKLTGLHSLKLLLLAHHEFDPNIPVRNAYRITARQQNIVKVENKYQALYSPELETIERTIPEPILQELPLYTDRLGIQSHILNPNQKQVSLFNQDKQMVIRLIADIDELIQKIRAQSSFSLKKRAIAGLIAVVPLILFAVLLEFLSRRFNQAINEYQDCLKREFDTGQWGDCKDSNDRLDAAMLAQIVGVIAFVVVEGSGLFAATNLWTNQGTLSYQIWNSFANQLQEVVSKLQMLPEDKRLALVSQAYMQTLTQDLNVLQQHQTKDQITTVLTQLKPILNELLKDMNRTQQPFTQRFFQPKTSAREKIRSVSNANNEHVIDIPEEEQPLLNRSLQMGYVTHPSNR